VIDDAAAPAAPSAGTTGAQALGADAKDGFGPVEHRSAVASRLEDIPAPAAHDLEPLERVAGVNGEERRSQPLRG
jgi:hypothetical protein